MSKATKALVPVAAVLLVAAVGLGCQATSAATKGPPTLNVKPSCEAAVAHSAMQQIQGSNVRDLAGCMRSENEARDQLAKEWAQFSRDDQQRCTSVTKTGGDPSYVELLGCLERHRDLKSHKATGRYSRP
jgi:hypothetical protein